VDSYAYSYDKNPNRTGRTNVLKTDHTLDETYSYDGLDRLSCTERGGSAFQSWGLDSLGNWAAFTDQGDDQYREHDAANQTGEITGDLDWIDPTYDNAGNMTLAPRPGQESCACEALLLVYDGWNRLAKAYEDTNGDGDLDLGTDALIATYGYDGQGRRIAKTFGDTTTHYYFNENWQVLETRVDTDPDPLDQYVWDVRYIDAPLVRFHDSNTDGDYEDDDDNILYYTQDANFIVTALVVERYMYAPYGKATVLDADWEPVEGNQSAVANDVLYAGYRLDPETGLYASRVRTTYHPTLGRWTAQDKIPYQDGLNLYQFCVSNPISATDPTGLVAPGPCARGCHAPGDRESAILGLGSTVARGYPGWSYASDLMMNYLSRGGNVHYGEASPLAHDLAAALRGRVDEDIRSQLPEGAGAIGPGQTKSVQISGTLANVEFKQGQLEASVRQPDSVTYVATLEITRCADRVNDDYHYRGSAAGNLGDTYGYKDSPPYASQYAEKEAYQKILLGLAYDAAWGRNLHDFTITVNFKVEHLEGVV